MKFISTTFDVPQMSRDSVRPGEGISLNAAGRNEDGTHPAELVQATSRVGALNEAIIGSGTV